MGSKIQYVLGILVAASWVLSGCGSDGDSCTVITNADGSATIQCEDGTSATVRNGMNGAAGMNGADGTDGMDGVDGMDGMDGGSCTVVDNGDGTKTISCDDGTTVTVSDGTDGMDGMDGMAGTVVRWAAVTGADGVIVRGSGTAGSTRIGAGTYEVRFDRDVTACSYVATVGNPGTGSTDGYTDLAARAGVATGVFVRTRDTAGMVVDRNFHLFVACP